MIRAFYIQDSELIRLDRIPKEYEEIINRESSPLWIDILNPSEVEIMELEKKFKFHHLALEDCMKGGQRPKMEEYDRYFFMVIHEIVIKPKGIFDIVEVDIFAGKNFVVTFHKSKINAIENLINDIDKKMRFFQHTGGFLFYCIADTLIDSYFPVLAEIDEKIDEIENEILATPRKKVLNEIFILKKEIVRLRKTSSPQREIFVILTNREFPQIDTHTQLYLRDIYDHLIRIYEILDSYRDLMTSAMDVYLSNVSNRLGENMKRLTIVATLFMPISFIAGVFGMNFKVFRNIDAWDNGLPFFLALLLMGMVTFIMGTYIKRKHLS